MQLTHYNTTFKKKSHPIVLVCDHISNAPNIGSLFRTADAFGIEKIIFIGGPIPNGRKMTKTSRSTEKVVPYEIRENIEETVQILKSSGYEIISLEITDNSRPLSSSKFHKHPLALIVGDENFGVSNEGLKLSDRVIHIDMFGQNSSMNVVQATSIALYEITKQLM